MCSDQGSFRRCDPMAAHAPGPTYLLMPARVVRLFLVSDHSIHKHSPTVLALAPGRLNTCEHWEPRPTYFPRRASPTLMGLLFRGPPDMVGGPAFKRTMRSLRCSSRKRPSPYAIGFPSCPSCAVALIETRQMGEVNKRGMVPGELATGKLVRFTFTHVHAYQGGRVAAEGAGDVAPGGIVEFGDDVTILAPRRCGYPGRDTQLQDDHRDADRSETVATGPMRRRYLAGRPAGPKHVPQRRTASLQALPMEITAFAW